jgi:Asp-tRNA(Asn)/Glu-tRNA(Gln) amidotransferase A subunit family amidase
MADRVQPYATTGRGDGALATAARVRAGEVSAVALCEAALERIARVDPGLNAFRSVQPELALAAARAVDAAVADGEDPGPLAGVPVAVKDNVEIAGMPQTNGSAIDPPWVSAADAHAVEGLRAAGAVPLGKLNLSEFALGGTGQNAHFGWIRNPWDPARTPGGSSGGSGAAVAADLALITLGTDTGGSIRLPAALNGVAGIRPTWGRVSNRGSTPCAASFDTIGPLARRVEDVAAALAVTAGFDPLDPATFDVPVADYAGALGLGVEGLRIGVLARWMDAAADPGVAAGVRAALGVLAELGAEVVEVELPGAEDGVAGFGASAMCEAAAFHAGRMARDPGGFGADVRTRLERGALVPGTAYAEARLAARALCRTAESMLADGLHAFASPTSPIVAPLLDGLDPLEGTGMVNTFTPPWALAGMPALSVPCGFVDGMPIGLQLAGRRFDEATVLRIGHAYQGATDWHLRAAAGIDGVG